MEKNLELKQIYFIFNDRVRKIKTRNDCFLMKPKLHMMSGCDDECKSS